ncbi:Gfo/Idh/MocA family oxidoreductase [Neoroseomonas oryzicola]|uniref:Gfo/Idh/MocA family oxidoreductase n=1 Tax=Neoroseomonas oryzicola TaxID=535904 RepID=A0A9X9WK06_9PROT|nr:Gfo/Idh/MocA family oxidoreductase [Neoroseomonas oryzicola]MBR0660666.1 Gfo/Idh/MocA family oxidoreductase [Neoroseomonas oryzicola]NKE17493.1 Gfo/Idh/MocA family oxidoreductase [Neoroseomonas oryzicola]
MAERIGLGIVGFGIMGERLARFAAGHEQVRIVGVWDPAPEAAARLAAAVPGVPMLASAEAVIAACDCLYVASPPAFHLAHAKAAFAAGKAAFLEKPLSVSTEEARAFVAAAEASGARGAVNFPMASSPAVAQLNAWRAEGAVGAPRELSITTAFAAWPRSWQRDAVTWLDKPQQGGFTREVVSHFLFLTRRQLGPIVLEAARATFAAPGRSETAIAARLTAGGVPVALSGGVGTTLADDHNAWVLEGPAGAIRLRDWSFAERRGADGIWSAAPDALPNERMRPMVLKKQLDGVAAMTRGETHHLATLREALEVQEVVEAILAQSM